MANKWKGSVRDERLDFDNVDGHHVSPHGWNSAVYFSKSLPQGESTEYTPDNYDYKFLEDATLVKDLVMGEQNRAAWEESGVASLPYLQYEEMIGYVAPIQEHLIKIGYLDKGDADGIMGPKTEGAIKRYALNKPSMYDEAWHYVKNMDLNPFD